MFERIDQLVNHSWRLYAFASKNNSDVTYNFNQRCERASCVVLDGRFSLSTKSFTAIDLHNICGGQ